MVKALRLAGKTYLHALDLLNDSVAGLIRDLNLAIVNSVAFLAECLGAKDCDTGRILSLDYVGASRGDYFLREGRSIEFVQHDWLAVHSVALVRSLLQQSPVINLTQRNLHFDLG